MSEYTQEARKNLALWAETIDVDTFTEQYKSLEGVRDFQDALRETVEMIQGYSEIELKEKIEESKNSTLALTIDEILEEINDSKTTSCWSICEINLYKKEIGATLGIQKDLLGDK